ncbi:MAG TPA: murein biosynthesis integral membrane protein MurJ [Candidatus Limnocylindrales bacterium]|nr:murein biosynthesis integral membrane protein MurJ [Candidatus Limnocylindrales bacterium]
MSGTARALARAGLVVTAAFLVSRILGWLRLVVISTQFGASAELDAYFAAFRVPDAVFQLVAAGAVSSALVPVLSGLLSGGEEERAWHVAAAVANAMLVGLLVLAAAFFVLAPWIVPFITPGFDAASLELTVQLTRLMLLSPIFLAMGAVATAVLNARGRFAASAVAPSVYNLAIIGGALLLGPWLGVLGLAIGTVLGSALHLAVQLPVLWAALRRHYRPRLGLADPAARQAFLLMAPRALGMGAAQITFVVNTALASALGTGAIVAYNVAFTVLQIPIGVIGVPLGIVLLPSMSRAMASGAVEDFGRLVVRSLRLLLYVMLFLTAIAVVLRREVVTLLFDYGRFDAAAVATTAEALLFFLAGLAAHAMIVVLARAFYADQDTRTPVMAALLSVAINVVVSVLSVGTLGLGGLALGIAVGAWAEAGLLALLLRRREPSVALDSVLRGLLVFGLGAALAGGAAAVALGVSSQLVGSEPARPVLLLQAAAVTALAGLVYLAWSLLLRLPELPGTIGLLRAALARGRVPAVDRDGDG